MISFHVRSNLNQTSSV